MKEQMEIYLSLQIFLSSIFPLEITFLYLFLEDIDSRSCKDKVNSFPIQLGEMFLNRICFFPFSIPQCQVLEGQLLVVSALCRLPEASPKASL